MAQVGVLHPIIVAWVAPHVFIRAVVIEWFGFQPHYENHSFQSFSFSHSITTAHARPSLTTLHNYAVSAMGLLTLIVSVVSNIRLVRLLFHVLNI